MNTTTLCWNCSREYASTEKTCPSCGSVNANLDLLTAIEQAGGYCHGLFPPHDRERADAAREER